MKRKTAGRRGTYGGPPSSQQRVADKRSVDLQDARDHVHAAGKPIIARLLRLDGHRHGLLERQRLVDPEILHHDLGRAGALNLARHDELYGLSALGRDLGWHEAVARHGDLDGARVLRLGGIISMRRCGERETEEDGRGDEEGSNVHVISVEGYCGGEKARGVPTGSWHLNLSNDRRRSTSVHRTATATSAVR